MKKTVLLATCVALSLPLFGGVAFAGGPIEKACLHSDRKAANRSVCGCIQDAADETLRSSDQRRAAKFFTDPEKAHQVKLSKSKSDDEFWDRYKAFGAAAQAMCGG
ncbi:MAG: hypothetical protein I8H94_03405 [Rhodobacteraceae bacterium]|nr:hypothetical protein [Paracoccaceae bacterium]